MNTDRIDPLLGAMGRGALVGALALGLSLLSAGCADSRAADHAHAGEPTPACSYKEGMGLQLTVEGAKFIGLRAEEFTGRLPADALLRTAKGDFVFVKNGDRYLRTPVKVGPRQALAYEVQDGLYEGDTVVVAGTRALWLAELQAVNGGVGCAHGH